MVKILGGVNHMEYTVDELVKKSRNKADYKERIEAIKELAKIDCPQRKDVIVNLAIHDRVFAVKEAAHHEAQKLKLTKNGKPISLGKKDIGYSNGDIVKKLARVKRESKMDEFDCAEFKERFKTVDPEMYDVLQFEKSSKFDSYLENQYKCLPKN